MQGEPGSTETCALVCDVLLLAMFLWNQLCYGMNMLLLIIMLLLIGVYLAIFGVIPEAYRFADRGLEIVHPLRKSVWIPYEAVFNFDATIHDSFINLLQGNKVKVYHIDGKTKKATVCRPRNAGAFVDVLKQKCPELHTDANANHRLETFFENENYEP